MQESNIGKANPSVDPMGTQKLTKWAKEPTLLELKGDLEEAKSFHDTHVLNLDKWSQNFEGAPIKGKPNRSTVVPRLIRKHAEWRYSALSEPFLSSDKLFQVNPVTWEDKKSAVQNELILNNQFSTKIDKVAFFDSYAREAVDTGTVVLRTSWVSEEAEVEEVVYEYEYVPAPEMGEQLQEWIALKDSNPNEYTNLPPDVKESIEISLQEQTPVKAVIVNQSMQKVSKLVKNHPFVETCDLRNLYIDPTCMGDLDKAGFIIYSYETSMSELKRSGKYENLDIINVESANPLSQPDNPERQSAAMSFKFRDEARKKLIAYEYWGFRDIDGSGITVPIVATWVGDTLIGLTENPFPDKQLPFVLVPYLPKRRQVYGEPDGELLIENQKIIGAVTRGMIDLLGQSANGQKGTAKGLLDATNASKFRKGEDYEYNPNYDPRTHMYTHEYPDIPQSAVYMIQSMNSDAESLTGVKAFAGGGLSANALGNSSSTAPAVRGVLDAASKREVSILRRLVNGLVKVARKFIAMNAVFLSDEEIVRITNDNFVVIRKDDLAGNFDLKINVSTPEEEAERASELSFMLQTMGNNIDAGMSKLLLSEIARLRKMPDLAKMIEQFEPQPDPLAEEERKADIEIKMAQAALYRAQAEEAIARSILQSAKVPVEQARADNLQSNADATKISTSNKDTGVEHMREMEKRAQDQQAKESLTQLQHTAALQQKGFEAEISALSPQQSM